MTIADANGKAAKALQVILMGNVSEKLAKVSEQQMTLINLMAQLEVTRNELTLELVRMTLGVDDAAAE